LGICFGNAKHRRNVFIKKLLQDRFNEKTNDKGKAIPVTGRGGPYGCEMLRFSYFLDNRLTDGDTVVSLKH
jgi:hypothetical protein